MRLKIAFMRNPRLEPLLDGTVQPDGVELDWHLGDPGALFSSHMRENAFDVFEFSISNYLILRSKPEWAHLQWTAIPIFLAKPLFIFRNCHVNTGAGIASLADLRGKRLGLPDYGMTAAVWVRIILRALYGIHSHELTWYNGRWASGRHTRILGIEDTPPPGVTIVNLDEHDGKELDRMLHRGEVDVAIGDNQIMPITEGPTVRKLFTADTLPSVSAALYREAGVTPVNHVLMMQQRLLAERPELASVLYDAFERAKQETYARAQRGALGYWLFPVALVPQQTASFRADPYPSGLAANRRMLTMVAEQLKIDGFIPELPDLDAIFAESTRAT
jgi:4,5-dihydroxyphthalate decarboxylase